MHYVFITGFDNISLIKGLLPIMIFDELFIIWNRNAFSGFESIDALVLLDVTVRGE